RGHRPHGPGGLQPGDPAPAVRPPAVGDLPQLRNRGGQHHPAVRAGAGLRGGTLRGSRPGAGAAPGAPAGEGRGHPGSAGPLRGHRPGRAPASGGKTLLRRPAARAGRHCPELNNGGTRGMAERETRTAGKASGPLPGETRMRMLYGVNQADQCRDFALGADRERIWRLLREVDTRLIRLFLFDKGAPDPVTEWPVFASYVQAVLNVGAVPMITFAKLHRPLDDPRAVRWFANQC